MGQVYWAPTRYQVLGYFSILIILFDLQCFNSRGIVFHCHVMGGGLSRTHNRSLEVPDWADNTHVCDLILLSICQPQASRLVGLGDDIQLWSRWTPQFTKLYCAHECNPDGELSVSAVLLQERRMAGQTM